MVTLYISKLSPVINVDFNTVGHLLINHSEFVVTEDKRECMGTECLLFYEH